MKRTIHFLHAAEIEIADAIDWYNQKEPGLGSEFRESIERAIASIDQNPLAYPVVQGSAVRRSLAERFPFLLVFTVDKDAILIIAVFHTSRNPMIWRGRV